MEEKSNAVNKLCALTYISYCLLPHQDTGISGTRKRKNGVKIGKDSEVHSVSEYYDLDIEAAALKHMKSKILKMREQSQEDQATGKGPDLKYELLRATYFVTMRKMQIRAAAKKLERQSVEDIHEQRSRGLREVDKRQSQVELDN